MSIRANYTEIPGIACQMASEGSDISRLLSNVFKVVDELKATWSGIRYNTVIADFNAIIPNINELEDLIITEIPTALGQVAKNYASVDGGTAPAVTEGTKVATAEISNAETDVLRFDSTAAETTLSTVKSNFSSIQDDLEKYKGQFYSLDWDSPAAENFSSRFESLSGNLKQSFENLCSAFEKAMTQAREDMEKADSSNNIG